MHMHISKQKLKLIIESYLLNEITRDESIEIQCKKVWNFLTNSLKLTNKTEKKYVDKKTLIATNSIGVRIPAELDVYNNNKEKMFKAVNFFFKQIIGNISGNSFSEKIANLSMYLNKYDRVDHDDAKLVAFEIAKSIIRKILKNTNASNETKQIKRDIKKRFMKENPGVNQYFSGIHNIGFAYIKHQKNPLDLLIDFLEKKKLRTNDEDSVWVIPNLGGINLPLYPGINVEIAGKFTMIYNRHDAMTDRWDGQHWQGGGDKSKQIMGSNRVVKHSQFIDYADNVEIDQELGLWKPIADIYRKQQQKSLTSRVDLLEGTVVGDVKSIILSDDLKDLFIHINRSIIGDIFEAVRKEMTFDQAVKYITDQNQKYFKLGTIMSEREIIFKDKRFNPAAFKIPVSPKVQLSKLYPGVVRFDKEKHINKIAKIYDRIKLL